MIWSEIPFFLFNIEKVKHIARDWQFFPRRESIDKGRNFFFEKKVKIISSQGRYLHLILKIDWNEKRLKLIIIIIYFVLKFIIDKFLNNLNDKIIFVKILGDV